VLQPPRNPCRNFAIPTGNARYVLPDVPLVPLRLREFGLVTGYLLQRSIDADRGQCGPAASTAAEPAIGTGRGWPHLVLLSEGLVQILPLRFITRHWIYVRKSFRGDKNVTTRQVSATSAAFPAVAAPAFAVVAW